MSTNERYSNCPRCLSPRFAQIDHICIEPERGIVKSPMLGAQYVSSTGVGRPGVLSPPSYLSGFTGSVSDQAKNWIPLPAPSPELSMSIQLEDEKRTNESLSKQVLEMFQKIVLLHVDLETEKNYSRSLVKSIGEYIVDLDIEKTMNRALSSINQILRDEAIRLKAQLIDWKNLGERTVKLLDKLVDAL